MARPVFRPIIFALKRAPTWPGVVVPYEPPAPTWVLVSGVWRNVGYWFSDLLSWGDGSYVESDVPIYDGMPKNEVIGTIKYVIDLYDQTGAENIINPSVASAKLNQIALALGIAPIVGIVAGSDAMDLVNEILNALLGKGYATEYDVPAYFLLMMVM